MGLFSHARRPDEAPMLQRSSPVPLYQQLKLLLADRIKRGEWKPGELIPGEHELQAIHRLSRTTVRQALQELEREGFVTRHRGRGTFVAQPRAVPEPAGAPYSIHARLLADGHRPGWHVLSAEEQPASPELAERLQIPVGAPVLTTRRIRLVDDRPLGYLEASVPMALLGPYDPALLTSGGSMNYLRSLGLLRGSAAERTVSAEAATADEAQLLELAPGAPVLKIHRQTISPDGHPIESCCSTYRGDQFRYRLPTTHEVP